MWREREREEKRIEEEDKNGVHVGCNTGMRNSWLLKGEREREGKRERRRTLQ